MPEIQRHLDTGSRLVIVITFVLFAAALFIKGVGHDLLLEAGVFLISVKLIIMAYKNGLTTRELNDRLDGLHTTLTRLEDLLESRRLSERMVTPADGSFPPESTTDPSEGPTP